MNCFGVDVGRVVALVAVGDDSPAGSDVGGAAVGAVRRST